MRRRLMLASVGFGLASPAFAWLPPPKDDDNIFRAFFPPGSTDLTGAERNFPAFVDAMGRRYDGPIRIVGHTAKKETGGMALSLARAQAVGDRLVALGVPAARIVAVEGVGDSPPLDRDVDSYNRRVEIHVERACKGACSP